MVLNLPKTNTQNLWGVSNYSRNPLSNVFKKINQFIIYLDVREGIFCTCSKKQFNYMLMVAVIFGLIQLLKFLLINIELVAKRYVHTTQYTGLTLANLKP